MERLKQFKCEALISFIVGDKREQRWIIRDVIDINDGTSVRGIYCKEPMRIHRQRKLTGPRDHVEHFGKCSQY